MKKIAVFISGGGRTLKNILEKISQGYLLAEVALVVSSSSTAKGIQIAEEAGVSRIEKVLRGAYGSDEAYSEAIFAFCREASVDLVVLGGWLKKLVVPADYILKVINIHPSLIPSFCGHGFYGHYVHEAAINYGVKISGCSVHYVDNEYDHGPVILQKSVPVLADDDADMLAARVFQQECVAYPEAIQAILEDRVEVHGRIVKILERKK
ncbi:MAG: phosphoribosylglycinamide formyltransferase [Planctomycetia bacterium]|nr:phosphoribosylglycinamide formyltransferase [Planctomycetia bacterium]